LTDILSIKPGKGISTGGTVPVPAISNGFINIWEVFLSLEVLMGKEVLFSLKPNLLIKKEK